MDRAELLHRSDVCWQRKKFIMEVRQPARSLMLLGLPARTITQFLDDRKPCAFKGTVLTRKVADLRAHHLTRENRVSKYASKDRTTVARDASRFLRKERSRMVEYSRRRSMRRVIPLPGCTKGKQDTPIRGPREATQHGPSPLSHQVDVNDMGAVSEDEFTEMEEFYSQLCDRAGDYANMVDSDLDTYISESTGGEAESDVDISGSPVSEPDDYDIEMAKLEDEGLFRELNTGGQTPDLRTSNPVNAEEAARQTKRNGESVFSPELPTVDRPGQVDHNQKRRKLEIGTNSSHVPPSGQRKKAKKQRGGKLQPHNLFCRSSSLAAVFEAALAVGALEAQEDSSHASELDALDLELLGEEPSNSKHELSSVNEDLKVVIGQVLYPLVSPDDLRVAKAAANLLDIHQGNSTALELEPTDRKALREAFGASDDLQPSGPGEEKPSLFDAIPRTAKFSNRCKINKSLMINNGYKFKGYDTPTGPSEEFQSFFTTRRLSKNILRQDKDSWNEEDTSFVLSGKEIAEPGAKFGAEFVAKRLLDGRKSPLLKIVRDSQMSLSKRQKRDSRHPKVKMLSSKEERKIAQIQKSGLSVTRAEPKAGEKEYVSKAKVRKSASKAKGKRSI